MKTILIALLATITISCASNGHGKCDAYSNKDTKNNMSDYWLDSIHNQNTYVLVKY
jgi:hypothetical protein